MEGFNLDRDFLYKETEKVLNVITDEVFVNKMKSFRETKGIDRERFAKANLTVKKLEQEGLTLPEDMRISSRTFEEGEKSILTYVDYKKGLKVVQQIYQNRPELIDILRRDNPSLFEELRPYLPPAIGGTGPIIDPGNPNNPTYPNIPGFPDNNTPVIPFEEFDPAGAWACACGGAATVCGGAGGGT